MNYQHLLVALGLAARLDLGEAVKTGSCTIVFDAALEVTLETDPNDSEPLFVYLYAALATIGDSNNTVLFSRLLQLQAFGLCTGQAIFGLDAASRRIFLLKRVALAHLESTAARDAVEEFINQAIRWRRFLPDLASSTPTDALPQNVKLHA